MADAAGPSSAYARTCPNDTARGRPAPTGSIAGEAIDSKERRTGKEHALAGQDNRTPALATIERRQDRDRDVIPQEEEGNEHT
jgi:hypothetical protein